MKKITVLFIFSIFTFTVLNAQSWTHVFNSGLGTNSEEILPIDDTLFLVKFKDSDNNNKFIYIIDNKGKEFYSNYCSDAIVHDGKVLVWETIHEKYNDVLLYTPFKISILSKNGVLLSLKELENLNFDFPINYNTFSCKMDINEDENILLTFSNVCLIYNFDGKLLKQKIFDYDPSDMISYSHWLNNNTYILSNYDNSSIVVDTSGEVLKTINEPVFKMIKKGDIYYVLKINSIKKFDTSFDELGTIVLKSDKLYPDIQLIDDEIWIMGTTFDTIKLYKLDNENLVDSVRYDSYFYSTNFYKVDSNCYFSGIGKWAQRIFAKIDSKAPQIYFPDVELLDLDVFDAIPQKIYGPCNGCNYDSWVYKAKFLIKNNSSDTLKSVRIEGGEYSMWLDYYFTTGFSQTFSDINLFPEDTTSLILNYADNPNLFKNILCYKVLSPNWQIDGNTSNDEKCRMIVADEDQSFSVRLVVFPNPTYGLVYIQTETEIIGKMVIADLQGKQIIEKLINSNQSSFDLSSLQPGCYFLSIFTDKSKHTHKIIKI